MDAARLPTAHNASASAAANEVAVVEDLGRTARATLSWTTWTQLKESTQIAGITNLSRATTPCRHPPPTSREANGAAGEAAVAEGMAGCPGDGEPRVDVVGLEVESRGAPPGQHLVSW